MTDREALVNSKQMLIDNWFQKVWTEENSEAISELMNPQAHAEGLGSKPLVGVAEFQEFHAALLARITDVRFTIDRCLEEGDWAAAFGTLTAKSRESGASISITGSLLVQFDGEVLIQGHNQFDFMEMWGQLGYLPMDSFARGLRGEKIA